MICSFISDLGHKLQGPDVPKDISKEVDVYCTIHENHENPVCTVRKVVALRKWLLEHPRGYSKPLSLWGNSLIENRYEYYYFE